MFADDVVLCSRTREEAEEKLEDWRRVLEDRGLKVSRKKTEYVCTGGGEKVPGTIKIQEEDVPRSKEFKYLGSTIQDDGGSDKEVERRIQAGWSSWHKVTGVLCDKRVPEKIKGRMYTTMVRPAMLYGMETVPVTKAQEKKMEVAEMKMLRFSVGLTRRDEVRNDTVRQRLGVAKFSEKLREARLRWYGHVCRKDDAYVGKRVREMIVGRRKRGRPRRRWQDCIKEDMKMVGVREEDAMDRNKWRSRICTGDPTPMGAA